MDRTYRTSRTGTDRILDVGQGSGWLVFDPTTVCRGLGWIYISYCCVEGCSKLARCNRSLFREIF